MARTDKNGAVVARHRVTGQFKRALEIISPAPQQRADCERDIVEALMAMELWDEINARRTPAEQRKHLQKLAKTLRAAIDLADQLGPYDLWWDEPEHLFWSRMRDLERLVKEIEAVADCIGKNMRKGAPKYNHLRYAAVERAYMLLTKYSKQRPTRYREGHWHQLAKVLFGDQRADLFDYVNDYLVRSPVWRHIKVVVG